MFSQQNHLLVAAASGCFLIFLFDSYLFLLIFFGYFFVRQVGWRWWSSASLLLNHHHSVPSYCICLSVCFVSTRICVRYVFCCIEFFRYLLYSRKSQEKKWKEIKSKKNKFFPLLSRETENIGKKWRERWEKVEAGKNKWKYQRQTAARKSSGKRIKSS